MEAFTRITSRVVPLPNNDIDTDIIVPARFLKVTDKAGMDQYLFRDWRFDKEGRPLPDFILNQSRAKGCQILLTGRNFGTGSSREHAPWALIAFGFRAVISTSFADIFRGNSLKNGLLPVEVPADVHADLFRIVEADPTVEVTIDLASQTLTIPGEAWWRVTVGGGKSASVRLDKTVSFPIDNFSKQCLLAGVDQLGYLIKQEAHIRAYEASHPSPVQTTAG